MINIFTISVTKNGKSFNNPTLSNKDYLLYIQKKREEINLSTKARNNMIMVEKTKTA